MSTQVLPQEERTTEVDFEGAEGTEEEEGFDETLPVRAEGGGGGGTPRTGTLKLLLEVETSFGRTGALKTVVFDIICTGCAGSSSFCCDSKGAQNAW